MRIKTQFKSISFIKIVILLLFFNKSYSQFVIQSDSLADRISLHKYASVANVGQRNLDIQYVMSNYNSLKPAPLVTENDDLGFTQSHYWARTEIQNATDSDRHYYFETARPITDVVELFIIDEATGEIKKQISGDSIPYAERSFENRKSIFKIIIEPHTKLKLFLHLKSDGEVIKIPMILYSATGFIDEVSFEQYLFGFFYGLLTIAAIIYFFFYFALREKTFLYYSLYVVFVGLLQFALDGFFFKYITPFAGWFSNHAVLFLAIIAAFLSGKYSEVFLKIKEHSKGFYSVFKASYILLTILLLSVIFIPAVFPYGYIVVNVLGLSFLILIVISICYLYYKKKPVDSFFVIGIFFLILGFTVFILNNFGIVANNFITQNSSKFGTGLEVIFLSLSMSNLIRNLKNEKNELNRIDLVRSEEMNDLKSYFLSNISHELRTPLNAILNLIDSISSDVEDDKIKRNCQVIKYSSTSLLSSVNDILDFSKIEKKEIKIEKFKFSPLAVLRSLKNNAEIRAKDKDLEFVFAQPDTVPNFFMGDEVRLIQIVNNVLNNAIKFTSEGYVMFKFDIEMLSDKKARLLITIVDSGVGISQEKKDSIFDSFSQNNIDNKRKFGGLGLGLYIVKTLVDMQDGTVVIDSKLGKGTTCKISIDYEVVAEDMKMLLPVEPEVYDLEGKTILVVEDNSINQMVIKMITKKWLNTTVIYANNGQEGLDAFKDNTIDIVLMDLQMPVMDGYEATIAIRNGEAGEKNKTIPIVAVTADVMEGTKLRVSEIGMNHYLSKPIKKDLLYQVIKELV